MGREIRIQGNAGSILGYMDWYRFRGLPSEEKEQIIEKVLDAYKISFDTGCPDIFYDDIEIMKMIDNPISQKYMELYASAIEDGNTYLRNNTKS